MVLGIESGAFALRYNLSPFEKGTHYVAKAGTELAIFLPQPLKSAGITAMCHHAWLLTLFFNRDRQTVRQTDKEGYSMDEP